MHHLAQPGQRRPIVCLRCASKLIYFDKICLIVCNSLSAFPCSRCWWMPSFALPVNAVDVLGCWFSSMLILESRYSCFRKFWIWSLVSLVFGLAQKKTIFSFPYQDHFRLHCGLTEMRRLCGRLRSYRCGRLRSYRGETLSLYPSMRIQACLAVRRRVLREAGALPKQPSYLRHFC